MEKHLHRLSRTASLSYNILKEEKKIPAWHDAAFYFSKIPFLVFPTLNFVTAP